MDIINIENQLEEAYSDQDRLAILKAVGNLAFEEQKHLNQIIEYVQQRSIDIYTSQIRKDFNLLKNHDK